MTDNKATILDVITALVDQGVIHKPDGVILWSSCNYCSSAGWTSTIKKGYPLVHKEGCFILVAQKWIEQEKAKKKKK